MNKNAIQFNGTPERATKISDEFGMEYDECQFDEGNLVIHTPKGNVVANKGDWIIKNNEGEIYTCDPEILELLYGEIIDEHINI